MPVPCEDSDTSPQQVYPPGGTTLASWGARPGEDVRELRRARGRGVSLNIKVSAGAWERAGPPPPSPRSSLPCPPGREGAAWEVCGGEQGGGGGGPAALTGKTWFFQAAPQKHQKAHNPKNPGSLNL